MVVFIDVCIICIICKCNILGYCGEWEEFLFFVLRIVKKKNFLKIVIGIFLDKLVF